MTYARRPRALRRLGALSLPLWVALVLSVPTLTLYAPAGAATSTTSPNTWAYAGARSASGSGPFRNGILTVSERFAYGVSLAETPGVAGTFELAAVRSMGAVLNASYCAPSCSNPTVQASVAYHAFEVLTGFTNLTTNSSLVLANGTRVAAYSVQNTTATVAAGLFDNDSERISGVLTNRGFNASVALAVEGSYSVDFSPALGLVPTAPVPGTSWTASAGFTSAGSWTANWSWARTTLGGASLTRQGSPRASFAATGNVSLSGSVGSPLTLSDGSSVDPIALGLTGPLRLREGFLFLPSTADLFGSSPPSGLPNGNGSVGESFSALDLAPSPGAHVGFLASATSYSSSSTASGTTAIDDLTPASAPAGALVVQAEPEGSVSVGCTVRATCGTSPGSGPAPALRPLGVVALGVAVVTVAAIGAAVVVTRRPKAPPRPNAALYPALANPAPRPPEGRARAGSGPNETESTDPDPLAHLW